MSGGEEVAVSLTANCEDGLQLCKGDQLTWRDMKLKGLAERERLDKLGDWARELRSCEATGGDIRIGG